MNNKTLIRLIIGLFAAGYSFNSEQLRAETSDTRTETKQDSTDKNIQMNDAARVTHLSKEYNVPPETIQNLRDKEQSWGEVTIELAMSKQLTTMDPKLYPTMNDALAKISAQRAEHMGWGEIAKANGFKLGPVISAAQKARHALRETPAEKRNESKREQRAEKHENNKERRENRQERIQHERPDHNNPQKTERPEMPRHEKR